MGDRIPAPENRIPRPPWDQAGPVAEYFKHGRYVLLSLVFLLALAGRRWRWDRYRLAAATAILFLVIGPGFAVQYTCFAAPLLLAASLPLGMLYGIVVGVFLGAIYWGFRTGVFPLLSNFTGDFPNAARPFRFVIWGLLIYLLVRLIRRTPPRLATNVLAKCPAGHSAELALRGSP